MKIITVSMLICIFIVPISLVYAGDYVSVVDAWVLEPPPGMKVMAAYMTLINNSENAFDLKEISSPQFEKVEMHRTVIENEQARMEKQAFMTVKGNGTLKFTPGASHLMLINPLRSFTKGDEIDLRLIFTNGKMMNIKAEVRKAF